MTTRTRLRAERVCEMRLDIGLGIGFCRGGGTPTPTPVPTPTQPYAVGLPGVSWYLGARQMTNLLAQGEWQTDASTGFLWDAASVTPDGDLKALPAGASNAYRILTATGPGTAHCAVIWLADATSGFSVTGTQVSNVSVVSTKTIGGVSYNFATFDYTDGYQVNTSGQVIPGAQVNFGTGTTNVTKLWCAEWDSGADAFVHPPFDTFWYPPFVTMCAGFRRIRVMDHNDVNFIWNPNDPVTSSNRARFNNLKPSNRGQQASLTVGSGNSQITFPASYYSPYPAPLSAFWQDRATAGITGAAIKFMPWEAGGNSLKVQVLAASGAGSVAFSPGTSADPSPTLTITPATGTVTAWWSGALSQPSGSGTSGTVNGDSAKGIGTQVYDWLKGGTTEANKAVNLFSAYTISFGGDGTGSVAPFGPTAMSGGLTRQAWGCVDIERHVELANLANVQLHLCVPYTADSSFLSYVADYCAANLTQKLIVESQNEPWNLDLGDIAAPASVASAVGYYDDPYSCSTVASSNDNTRAVAVNGQSLVAMSSAFKGAYASRSSDLEVYANFQQGSAALANYSGFLFTIPEIKSALDAAGTAPYTAGPIIGGAYSLLNPAAWVSGHAYAVDDVFYYAGRYYICVAATSTTTPPTTADSTPFTLATPANMTHKFEIGIEQAATTLASDVSTILAQSKKVRLYEGGLHTGLANDVSSAGVYQLSSAIQTDDATETFYNYYIGRVLDAAGTAADPDACPMQYVLVGRPSNFIWGAWQYDEEADATSPRGRVLKRAVPKPFFKVDATPTLPGVAPQIGSAYTITDCPGYAYATRTYQWAANGTPISGATSASYTPVSGDLGKTLTRTETLTDTLGASVSITSAASTAVTPRTRVRVYRAGVTSFAVSSDITPTKVTVDILGASGNGYASATNSAVRSSGGSGGFSRYSPATVPTPGTVINCFIAGAGSEADSWAFNSSTCLAHGGKNATSSAAGIAVAAAIGDLTYGGAAGSLGSGYLPGAGAPGQSGPNGVGGAGAVVSAATGGGGGGGADGGSAAPTPDQGGPNLSAGGDGRGGTGHGTGGGFGGSGTNTTPPTPGTGAGAAGGPYDSGSSLILDASDGAMENLYFDSLTSTWFGPMGGGGGSGFTAGGVSGKGGNGAGSGAGGGLGLDGAIVVTEEY